MLQCPRNLNNIVYYRETCRNCKS